jgi:uncharacterized membrane protein
MDSRAKLFGHAVHQMLIVFPLGLLGGAIVFDIIGLITGAAHWFELSFWTIALGVITALISAVFGLIDWLAIPRNTRAKSVGAVHGLGNVVVVAFFALSWALRYPNHADAGLAQVFSFVGFGLAAVTGWLGGELVDRLGVGVDEGANLNAPSSLSRRPASARV